MIYLNTSKKFNQTFQYSNSNFLERFQVPTRDNPGLNQFELPHINSTNNHNEKLLETRGPCERICKPDRVRLLG